MAKLLRETSWHGFTQGDVFRVAGINGRRFRFQAHVTNLDNGQAHIEATDIRDGAFRAFHPERRLVKDAKASTRLGT